jgi:hypothetical protein
VALPNARSPRLSIAQQASLLPKPRRIPTYRG